MSTTPEEILHAAYATSSKNDPREIYASPTPLRLVTRALEKVYAIAARVNPLYYGAEGALEAVDGGWLYPAAAEAVWMLRSAGAEVVVVPADELDADTTRPAVTFFGRRFRPAGNPLDPQEGTQLHAFYSAKPAPAAALDAPVDPMWEPSYNDVPALEVATQIALNDGRLDEVQQFRADRDEALRLFVMRLEHAVTSEVRNRRLARTVHASTLVPLNQLLAGGSSVQL
jgi:hypothetical protein